MDGTAIDIHSCEASYRTGRVAVVYFLHWYCGTCYGILIIIYLYLFFIIVFLFIVVSINGMTSIIVEVVLILPDTRAGTIYITTMQPLGIIKVGNGC